MGECDKALSLTKKAYIGYKHIGRVDCASASLCYSIFYYLNKDSIEKAKDAIDEYVSLSKMLDENGNLKEGKELFYYFLGLYYEKINKLDSSLYFYRKVTSYPSDVQNKEAGYKGLMSVYGHLQAMDSVWKYAKLYADAKDTANVKNSANEVSRVKALYDYSEYQKIAKEKAKEADKSKQMTYISIILSLILFFCIYLFYKREKLQAQERLKEVNRQYSDTLEKYIHAKIEFSQFKKSHEIFEKEKMHEITALYTILSKYQDIDIADDFKAEQSLHLHECVKSMHKKANIIKVPQEYEWKRFMQVVADFLPDFFSNLANRKELSDKEIRICALERLCFSPYEIGVLMNYTSQNITNIRSRINMKLFGQKGAKTFNRNIRSL